jgi:hypothetical protein
MLTIKLHKQVMTNKYLEFPVPLEFDANKKHPNYL